MLTSLSELKGKSVFETLLCKQTITNGQSLSTTTGLYKGSMSSEVLHSGDVPLDSSQSDDEGPHRKKEELWTLDAVQYGSEESEGVEKLADKSSL